MPDPREEDHSERGLMFGKCIKVYDEVWSAVILK